MEAGDPHLHPEQMVAFRDRVRSRLADNGSYAGLTSAELFKRISDL